MTHINNGNKSLKQELSEARKKAYELSENLCGDEPLECFDELDDAVSRAVRLEKEATRLRKLQEYHGGKKFFRKV